MKDLMSKQQMSLGYDAGGNSAQIKALEDILEMLKQREGMKLSGKGGAPEVAIEVDGSADPDSKPGLDPALEAKGGESDDDSEDEDKLKELYASMKL